jgi:hypothetical protein
VNLPERAVYDAVKRHVGLKLLLRNSYQGVFSVLPAPAPASAYPVRVRPGCFFGFHDHTPFGADNTMLLANRVTTPHPMPAAGVPVEVGCFRGPDLDEFQPVATSRAWNWQMGCKLQWRGPAAELVFNDIVDGTAVGRIVHAHTGETRTLPDAVSSVDAGGVWAVGYSFARVERYMPGYGYAFQRDEAGLDAQHPGHTGVHAIHLATNERRLLFSLEDLAGLEPRPSMQDAWHFATHALFAPGGRRFAFLHRWIDPSSGRRHSRLVSSDVEGRDLCVFRTTDMVSHFGWKDAAHLVAYCGLERGGDGYAMFRDSVPEPVGTIGRGVLRSDGHLSFERSGRWMVTDTYPDRRRRQHLIVFDTLRDQRRLLALLPTPPAFHPRTRTRGCACDLHPRWSPDGSYICFDSAHTGVRSLCTIHLGSDLEREGVRSLARG